MSTRVTVNTNLRGRAEDAARKAAQAAFRELFAAMQQSFTAKAWDWPTATLRGGSRTLTYKLKSGEVKVKVQAAKNRKVVESPRNIIDLGILRASGSWEINGFNAKFKWSAKYATAVHEGYRRFHPDGSYSTWPARPWTSAVLGKVRVNGIEPFPLQQRMRDTWLVYFKASRR